MAQHIMHYPLGLLLLFEYISKFWSPVISNYSSNYSHDKSPHIYQKCENVVLYVLTHSQVMRAACKSASRLQCDQSSWAAVVWQTTNSCSITSVTHSTTNKNSTSLTIYSLRQKRRPYHCITLDTHGWFCSPTPNKQYTMVKVQNNSTKQVLYIFIYVGTEIAKKNTVILSTSFEGPSFHPWEWRPRVVERWICHVDGTGLTQRSQWARYQEN